MTWFAHYWGWVMAAIAVLLLASLVGWAIWLWHKASDVFGELVVLGQRLGRAADVLAKLDLAPLERGGELGGVRPGDLDGAWDEHDRDDDPQHARSRPGVGARD